jgi:enoyl-CoA hydratase/carnithine racemase
VVLDEFASDAQIRVVILRGEGEKAFVSGADISQFKEKRSSAEAVQTYNAASDRASRALNEFSKPLIAMIRGYCIGGGLGVATACDLRIASDNSRFGVPAAKLGLGYRYSGIKRLADLVGPSFTAEIFYTGRQFDAQEALQMGLVNRVLPVVELEKYVLDYKQRATDHRRGQTQPARNAEGPRRTRSRVVPENGGRLFRERGLPGRADRLHGEAQARFQGTVTPSRTDGQRYPRAPRNVTTFSRFAIPFFTDAENSSGGMPPASAP